MKHVVVTGDLEEKEIRPPSLFSKLRELSIEDAQTYFGDRSKLVDVPCPACGSTGKRPVFEKSAFQYQQCDRCKSVFVSPRPAQRGLAEYYRNSRASQFRVEHFAKETVQARRFHILRSHANWLGRLVDERGNSQARGYADIETSYPVIFEEVKRLGLFERLYSLNPHAAFDDACGASGATVSRDRVTGLGAVSAFEALEHQFSPLDFLTAAHQSLATGGLLFFTTRTISGFDLQVLWDKAPYIYVPEHLNLLSIDGIRELLDRAGFTLIELSTPGQLDVELTLGAIRQDPSIRVPPFIRYLLNHRDHAAHADFQEFLQKHRLSSHIRVAGQKQK